MELKELIEKDLSFFERKRYAYGKTKNNLLSQGFSALESINELVNGDTLDNPFIPNTKHIFTNEIFQYFDYLNFYAKQVINGFNGMGFYFLNSESTKMSQESKKNLFKSFLKFLGDDFYKLYKDLLDNNRVFIIHSHNNEGESFSIPSRNSYYLMLSDAFDDDLLDILTLSHELGHIYSSIFLANYRTPKFNIQYNFYTETISLFIELLFYHFLITNHLYDKESRFNRNLEDATILYHFKVMKFLYDVTKISENLQVTTDNDTYQVIGDISGFGDVERFRSGTLSSFAYSMSSIEAHKLYEAFLKGGDIKNIINDFLISMTYDDSIKNLIKSTNIHPLMNGVNERFKELKIRYLNK